MSRLLLLFIIIIFHVLLQPSEQDAPAQIVNQAQLLLHFTYKCKSKTSCTLKSYLQCGSSRSKINYMTRDLWHKKVLQLYLFSTLLT